MMTYRKDFRPRLSGNRKAAFDNITQKERRILVVGDIHAPFELDGYGDELDFAIQEVQKWVEEFPVADVCIGNHDRIIMRKAFDSQIPKRWVKSYNEVLGTDWNWVDRIVYDDVQYVHGEGGTARTKAKNDMMSTVQGHIHTQAYTEWMVGRNFKVFGMQVGCGVDCNAYAAAYAKNFKKQAIGCGVVIGGHTAINRLMEL